MSYRYAMESNNEDLTFQFQARKKKVIASSFSRAASVINVRKDHGNQDVVTISASSALNETRPGAQALTTNQ